MNETNHPARRLRHGKRPTEPLVFEDAAANKAAEEGEPTDAELVQEVLLEDLEAIADYWSGTEVEGASGNTIDVGKDLREKFAALKFPAIAADRASRQVANKAEVEGIASSEIPEGWPTEIWLNAGDEDLAPFSEYDELSWCSLPQGENDIRYVREDLLDTPPATTGASTARDQALEEAAALVEGCDKRASLRGISIAIRALKGSVGASTVLTDERKYTQADMERYALHVRDAAMERVAAQAGQVAVPDFRNVTAVKRISDQSLTITFASCASCSKFERAAAPSPAKESK